MIKRAVFVAGVSAGYLFGTPAGRRQLEKVKAWAGDVWRDPRVQEYVQEYESQAAAFAKKQGAAVWEKAVDTAKSAVSSSSSSTTTKYADASPTVVEPLLDADDANPGQR
ncbi:YtxH domain-containing protein [Cellulomonas fengjieae]|uniref:YtxH domain-containing protein n=1 Tax=Cellulomonas fengjieae TaxID=2819978 RepID=A0ABS3SJU0_9CELL|nr:YtxH domain-containing protein [Cellulomonas fengjieae]MBO3085221.1 YtxH domain-containing protein [Cellulomonas fengjieae]MBO3100963.1 YtxH domain-containing protein [Cellulomonas fengjieae]QVI66213.1 YtxH domain-containing protein [Cellulomonas fengjieae]